MISVDVWYTKIKQGYLCGHWFWVSVGTWWAQRSWHKTMVSSFPESTNSQYKEWALWTSLIVGMVGLVGRVSSMWAQSTILLLHHIKSGYRFGRSKNKCILNATSHPMYSPISFHHSLQHFSISPTKPMVKMCDRRPWCHTVGKLTSEFPLVQLVIANFND